MTSSFCHRPERPPESLTKPNKSPPQLFLLIFKQGISGRKCPAGFIKPAGTPVKRFAGPDLML